MEKAELIKEYRDNTKTANKENHPVIAAMMETLDNSVGRVISKINALGLGKNTIVIF